MTDPHELHVQVAFESVTPAIVGAWLMTAVAGGAALAHWRPGRELEAPLRTRIALVVLVLAAGGAARVYAGTDWEGPMTTIVAVGGALVLALMTSAPVDAVGGRAAFFSLGLVALVSATCFAEEINHLISSFGMRTPLTIVRGIVRTDRQLSRCVRADLAGLFPLGVLAWALARRVGAWRAFVLATPALLMAFVVASTTTSIDRYLEAALARYVGPVTDHTVDVARTETSSWDELEVYVQHAVVVHRHASITADDRAYLDRLVASAAERPSLWPPTVSVLADRDAAVAEVLAAVDPQGDRRWLIELVYETRPPFDAEASITAAFPWVRAQLPVVHRLDDGERALLRRATGHAREQPIDDDATIGDAVAIATSTGDTGRIVLRTTHPAPR